jgi:hypothetical protein
LVRAGRRRHDGGEEARVKSVFLIEADMLGALREGEQPGVARFPVVELLHGAREQGPRDATFL